MAIHSLAYAYTDRLRMVIHTLPILHSSFHPRKPAYALPLLILVGLKPFCGPLLADCQPLAVRHECARGDGGSEMRVTASLWHHIMAVAAS